MNSQKITFIVPLYNHLEHSRAMLDSLIGSVPGDLDFEVMLVDDGSSDGTRAWLGQPMDSRIRPIFNDANIGYAKSNNRAAAVATGSILGLLNNDLLLAQGWLQPMLEVLRSPVANAGIVGNIQFRVADDSVDHAGIQVNHLSKVEHVRTVPPPGQTIRRSLAVTGACCLIWRSDFTAVGGFDERYVNGGEDVDLCLKLRARHRYAYIATSSRVRHHVSLTRGRTAESQESNERNSRLLFEKWRTVIQQETKNAWMEILSSATEAGSRRIINDFYLADTYHQAPHAVSGILAKSICHREDMRWRAILDADDSSADQLRRVSLRGFQWARAERHAGTGLSSRYPWTGGCGIVIFRQGCVSRSIVISGEILACDGIGSAIVNGIVVGVQINGVQKRSWRNLGVGEFNLCIERPVSIPQRDTVVSVNVTWASDTRRPEPGWRRTAVKAVRFCTIIADDRVVLDLAKET